MITREEIAAHKKSFTTFKDKEFIEWYDEQCKDNPSFERWCKGVANANKLMKYQRSLKQYNTSRLKGYQHQSIPHKYEIVD